MQDTAPPTPHNATQRSATLPSGQADAMASASPPKTSPCPEPEATEPPPPCDGVGTSAFARAVPDQQHAYSVQVPCSGAGLRSYLPPAPGSTGQPCPDAEQSSGGTHGSAGRKCGRRGGKRGQQKREEREARRRRPHMRAVALGRRGFARRIGLRTCSAQRRHPCGHACRRKCGTLRVLRGSRGSRWVQI